MSFGLVAVGWVIGGLAALAGVLYLLQRLRVRHREVVVVTTRFWDELLEETRARVFVRRFRHPWAYALLLAIAGLLWLAVARPEVARSAADARTTVLLDASAGMARPGRLSLAKKAVLAAVEHAVGADVFVCGAQPLAVLRADEHPRLLRERLEGIEADPAPATLDRVIRSLVHAGGAPRALIIVGDAPLPDGAAELLPERWTLQRAPLGGVVPASRGVTALGVTEAASGRWDRVDVFAECRGPGLDAGLAARLGDAPLRDELEERVVSAVVRQYVWRDVTARGQRLSVSVAADPVLPADDTAAVVLPDRTPLRVKVAASLPDSLRDALAVDSGIVLVESAPDVEVLDGVVPAAGPALRFVSAKDHDAFVVTAPGDDPGGTIWDVLQTLGLDQIDATALATRAGRAVTLSAQRGDVRELAAWRELVTPEYDFVQTRAFPLFTARAMRWLAGTEPLTHWIRAGEPVFPSKESWRDESGRRLATGGGAFTPPHAGAFRTDAGATLVASILDPALAAPSAPMTAAAADARGGRAPWTWLALAAAALLLVEWHLFGTGRIP